MDKICAGKAVKQFPTTADPPYNNSYNNATTDINSAENAPNVVGMTLAEAKIQLSSYNLTIYNDYSDTVPSGTVISQEVQNQRVVLHVSKGPKT